MRPVLLGLVLVAASVLACGCGSSSGGSTESAPSDGSWEPAVTPRPQYDFRDHLTDDPRVLSACTRYADAELSYESTCTTAIAPEKHAYYTELFRLSCLVAASEPATGFAPPEIDACSQMLATWQAARCQNRPHIAGLRNPLDVCKAFLMGTGKAGDACTAGVECASGRCMAPFTVTFHDGMVKDYVGCGTCARIVGLGEACDDTPSILLSATATHTSCAAGLGCHATCTDASTPCTAKCVAGGAKGEECFTDYACATGLECRSMSIPGAFQCVAPKPTGAPCAEQNECAADDVCHAGTCTPQSLEGEPCRIDGATIPFDTGCIGSLECTAALTCKPPTLGPLAAPGTTCGLPLVAADDCAYGAPTCLASEGTLCPAAPRPNGGTCVNATDCDILSICVDQLCQPLTAGACKAGATVE